MKPLESLIKTTLLWKQPKWAIEHYELWAGEDQLGELYWTKCLSDEAVARCGGLTWTLDRRGFFRDRVVAVEAGSEALAASFTFEWLKDGDLVLADGRSFHWYRTKVFGNAWALVDKARRCVRDPPRDELVQAVGNRPAMAGCAEDAGAWSPALSGAVPGHLHRAGCRRRCSGSNRCVRLKARLT